MFRTNSAWLALLLGLSAVVAGCTSAPPDRMFGLPASGAAQLDVCHGFNCYFRTKVAFGGDDATLIAGYFAAVDTPAAERAAISRSIQHFENKSTQAIGIADGAKSSIRVSGKQGQMDCIDESTNTRTLLLYLAGRELLKHHKVEPTTSRGIILDARYFHSTAVVRDSAGKRWAIDSWYEPAGGPPDIMPLDEWRTRGVLGER